MASAAASAFLEAVMGKLFMVLDKEYNKHKALEQEVASLQQEFRMVAAAMDDQLLSMGRSDAHARTAVARLHAEEMLDLEHDIEDCVDRFTHLLTCSHSNPSGRTSLVCRVKHEVKKVQSRSSFSEEIQKLRRRLSEAQQRVISNIINPNPPPSGFEPRSSSSTPARAACGPPVGIGEPMEELLSLLDEVEGEPEQVRVISIVGFGGLGKTTLAKAVYDDPRTKEKFYHRAWIAAVGSPETSDWMRGILRDVLRQVRPGDAMDVDGQHLEASLREYLKDKRYLIVIDDIDVDQLRIIESIFPDNGTGSRIIVTTDNQQVANTCSHGNGYVYQMKTLGKEDSKKLAFSGLRSVEPGQGPASLLAKCDGLPLALVSVSDYLKSSSEPTGELCAELCLNLGSDLKEDGHYSFAQLRKVLLDNYDSFSGYTLSCLLYLGIFPNNRPLKKKVVIRRWLAEGYARSDDPRRSEEYTADKNFRKLIDRNIIQPVDTRNNSEVKTCKTHGIMHEFLLNKSLAQRFIGTSLHDHPRVGINTSNARHLSVDAAKQTECVASDEELSRVRSLTIFGDAGDTISCLRKCKLLRVLDLQECNGLNDDHLKHMYELWHLKYLSLGGYINELPRSIQGLHCLETLDLRRTEIKFLPIEAIMLPHLAHLFGKFMLHKDDLKNAKKMSKLQKFFSSNKSNLKTLAGFITEEGKEFLQLIGHMKKLRKVKIWCKHVEGSSNYIADLSKAIQEFTKTPIDMDRVRFLSLDSEECSENFLSSIHLEPCSEDYKYTLKSLKLHGNLLQLPLFVTLLSGLIELCISSATLTQEHLSALTNLNSLLYLKLVADKLENFEIKLGAFLSLRRLCFVVKNAASALPKFEQGAMPNLVSLQLLCQGLVGLSGIEIRHLKHLKEVTIDSRVTAQTRQDWEQAAKNHPNRPRVLLLGEVHSVESEEPGRPMEKRRICVGQASSEDERDSSLKRMRLSDPSSSRLQVIGHPHPVVVTATEAASQPSMAN
ncbi:disease resistance protein RGA4-like [Oryza sativa Japonica Group]|uniref:NB-ARC domain containing protein, expressed n=3 Tax=Oryza sativa subsp. japonica TaxID=39947 RepID=Q2QZJ3_ORYSJ|nr:disease resistance protein RGA4-like [Oryza sativa Japonica Group]ABA95304.1 NB-ARC domain containing protein, expressed [Oryza sativa Japonica Group]BAH95447.1 Os11g0684700 [Oryza sativa Japonica Group]BAT15267.1 Os11g0684700 [Oryza sativa Japonica Group]|eukprot:NP_001176719.1 Os11g0684700 [Oryza sativa Japonica Group]